MKKKKSEIRDDLSKFYSKQQKNTRIAREKSLLRSHGGVQSKWRRKKKEIENGRNEEKREFLEVRKKTKQKSVDRLKGRDGQMKVVTGYQYQSCILS